MSTLTTPAGSPASPTGPGRLASRRMPRWGIPCVYGVAAVVAVVLGASGFSVGGAIILAAIAAAVVAFAWSAAVEGRRKSTDLLVTLVVGSAFVVALAPLVSLVVEVVRRGAVRFDVEFLTVSMRNVVGAGGGVWHAIVGTLVITALTTLMAVPVGVLTAVYLHEYGGGRLNRVILFFVDVMTGIPSIVAGLFAFAVFSVFVGPGVRMGIMGAVALSILMVPIVVRSTEEMLKIVPRSLREASYALGVTKARTILKVVLPTALAGIVTGIMVAVARVMGETAPLLLTAGAVTSTNWNPFAERMQTLPVFAFDSYRSPGVPAEPYLDRAWAAALVLIVIVLALNLVARLIYRRFGAHLR